MELTFVDQIRLSRTPDGRIWGGGGAGYSHFSRYLRTFDSIRVICRTTDIEDAPAVVRCDGPGVAFVSLSNYLGPWQYVRNRQRLWAEIRRSYKRDSAYLLRVPSQLGFDFARVLSQHNHPFGVLVVADPDGEFSPGATRSLLRPLIRLTFRRKLTYLCRTASACGYVTRKYLQAIYPSASGRQFGAVSDTNLPEWLVAAPRRYEDALTSINGISVGSLANM